MFDHQPIPGIVAGRISLYCTIGALIAITAGTFIGDSEGTIMGLFMLFGLSGVVFEHFAENCPCGFMFRRGIHKHCPWCNPGCN